MPRSPAYSCYLPTPIPKPVIAAVNGWAAGAGLYILLSSTDIRIASAEHARFKQTDADVGSFDGGYGSAYLAKMVGQKNARENFFLARTYSAEDMQRLRHAARVGDRVDGRARAARHGVQPPAV